MLRKLAVGLLSLALVSLPLGCSGGTSGKKEDEKKGDEKKGDEKKSSDSSGGTGDAAEDVATDSLKAMNDLADALEKVTDKASAEKVKPEIEAIVKRAKDAKERGDKLPEAKQKELQAKHLDAMQKAARRMFGAMTKLAAKPDAAKVLDPVLKELK